MMKFATKIGMMVVGILLICQAGRAQFTINDLYIGFSQSTAQSDYDIDLGQPGVVGVGSSSVVDLSGDFSLTVFNSIFTDGADGVVVAVVGGNNQNSVNPFGVYATALRVGGPGASAAVAGSNLSTKSHASAAMSGGAGQVAAILSQVSPGLPKAGSNVVDSTKSFTAIVDTTAVQNNFIGKTGVNPSTTIGSTSIAYLDLWHATTTSAYTYLGYFTIDLATPVFTFTPSGTGGSSPPVASFTGGPTNGFAGFSAVFTNNSTGTITNYIWDFGDGTIVTNSTGVNVTHVYAAGGDYNVTLTVQGPGGVNVQAQSSFINVSPLPTMIGHAGLSGGQFVLSGTNCPAGAQYRILNTTNLMLPVTSWTPVVTNIFNPDGTYSYTNSPSGAAGFFRLVSP
jgi:PKD repeat protein